MDRGFDVVFALVGLVGVVVVDIVGSCIDSQMSQSSKVSCHAPVETVSQNTCEETTPPICEPEPYICNGIDNDCAGLLESAQPSDDIDIVYLIDESDWFKTKKVATNPPPKD